MMTTYLNHSGRSGVAAFQIGPDSITVRFVSGQTYRYTHATAGRHFVEEMKRLAAAGRGLSTYISQHVGAHYAERIAA